MYCDIAFKDFTHLRWLSRKNSISGRSSFKTNTMFTLIITRLSSFLSDVSNRQKLEMINGLTKLNKIE